MSPLPTPPTRSARRPRYCRPRLEALEARWAPSVTPFGALRDFAGFDHYQVARGDDNSSSAVALGFTVNLFGQSYDHVFVNTNGSVSFGRALGREALTAGPFEAHFDFGTSTSPVAAGFTQVTETTEYSAGRGYGWLPEGNVVQSRERRIGSDLTRDFIQSLRATFVVDLPNGTYDVTATFADAAAPHEQAVIVEGQQVDFPYIGPPTHPHGEVVRRTYRTTVTDGQLTFTIDGLAGSVFEPTAILNALEIGKPLQPSSLTDLGGPVFAPFLADADTSPADAGQVVYGQGTVNGHNAFAATWQDVGAFGGPADPGNTFQVVFIERADRGPGAFDVEHNYGTIGWDRGGHDLLTARAGYTDGNLHSGRTYEALGSGSTGALLDGGTNALAASGPISAVPGRQVFIVRSGGVVNEVAPVAELLASSSRIATQGAEWVAQGRFSDADGEGPWTVQVDYGDGTGLHQVTAAADGTFELRHEFAAQSTYAVVVTVTDPYGATGQAFTRVFVLPAGAAGRVEASIVETARAGETIWPKLETGPGTVVGAKYTRSAEATGEVSVFLALYDGSPVATEREGLFLDIQVGGAAEGDQVTVNIASDLLKGAFEFGYFDHHTGAWVSLLDNPELCTVTVDATTGTMTVHFKVTNIFSGTVFTVSLPTGNGVQSTGTVRGPTASAGDTSGLGRTVNFSNSTELAVALSSSRTSQQAVGATDTGSQAAGASASAGISGGPTGGQAGSSSASQASDEKETTRSDRSPRDDKTETDLWELILPSDLLQRLQKQAEGAPVGADAGSLGALQPEPCEELALREGALVSVAAEAEVVEVVAEELAVGTPAIDRDDGRLALGALAVAAVVAWHRDEQRRRRQLQGAER